MNIAESQVRTGTTGNKTENSKTKSVNSARALTPVRRILNEFPSF